MSNNEELEAKLKGYEQQGCLHEWFSRQAKETPTKTAVVGSDGTKLTFAQLDQQTDLLAAYLQQRGVKVDDCVGIYMERCIEYVISYIAILKAGGAYLPLDVTYPESLLCDVFDDAKPICVLSNENWCSHIQSQNVFVLKDNWTHELKDLKWVNPNTSLDNLAYVVYSSGTTGKPKGIMCPHRGAVFSYTWRQLAYPFEEDERVACNVFFVWEMLRSLLKGIPLYVIPDTVIYDPRLLTEFLGTNKITRILFTPSLLQTVLDDPNVDLDLLKPLRIIWFCGEVVTSSLLERCMKKLPWIKFLNLYSISECHDVAADNLSKYWKEVGKDIGKRRKFSPVGKVLPGVGVVILDENNNQLPVGVQGEIYVGGPTLARGYLNRPEINKLRFIDRPKTVDPNVGDRLYRTGDWGLMVGNRVLEICGRCDSMVKIRGYSIETQAVEAALLELPMVSACVVLALGDEGEDKQLVTYVVPNGDVTKKDVRAALKRKLPFYMIPSQFIFMKSIPVLPASGKLDKKALPSARQGRRPTLEKLELLENVRKVESPVQSIDEEDDDDLPKTANEHKLADIWSEILQFSVEDVNESFFDLGGHSLLAAKLIGKLREVYGLEISVKTLFSNPTISQLSSLIDSLQKGEKKTALNEDTLDLLKEVKNNVVAGSNLDIQLRSFWRSIRYGDKWKRGRILITGVTGFLGSYLLKSLLFNTEALESRLHVMQGDVALANLGLSDEDYDHLSYEIDSIIHSAAYVNLLYPYEALKGANVHGTRNILRLARVGKIKPLHYVSTNSVFPNNLKNCKEEPTSSTFAINLDDGYSQSKWVAEQLVVNATELGLPATIYRMGNISGDQKRAGWNPSDFILLVLRASVETGLWPDVDWIIEMSPVDFVSDFIINQTQSPPINAQQIFHLINPNTVSSRWLQNEMTAFGFDLKRCLFDTWCEKVLELSETSQIKGHMSVRKMLDTVATTRDKSLFLYNSIFDVTNTMRNLTLSNKSYPKLSHELIKNYLENLSKRKVLMSPIKCVPNGQQSIELPYSEFYQKFLKDGLKLTNS